MAFQVVVDDYTVLSIGGAYNLVQTDKLPTQSLLFQASNHITDYPSIYYENNEKTVKIVEKKFIIPVFNIVIKVDEGKITGVVWDDDCSGCNYEGCYNHKVKSITNSSLTYDSSACKAPLCGKGKDEVFKCDPKFYLTWFGTDKDKKQMKSSNLAMSRFRAYSIGSLYSSARDVFNNTLTDITNTY